MSYLWSWKDMRTSTFASALQKGSTSPGARSETVYAGRRYGIPALHWSAWNHAATSFWPTASPVCRSPLNSCTIYCSLCSARNLISWLSGKSLKLLRPDAIPRRKICQKMRLRPGSAGLTMVQVVHLNRGLWTQGAS